MQGGGKKEGKKKPFWLKHLVLAQESGLNFIKVSWKRRSRGWFGAQKKPSGRMKRKLPETETDTLSFAYWEHCTGLFLLIKTSGDQSSFAEIGLWPNICVWMRK